MAFMDFIKNFFNKQQTNNKDQNSTKLPQLTPSHMVYLYNKNSNPETAKSVTLREFDSYIDCYLYGHRNKKFYLAQDKIFSELYNELQTNPNCSYVTYANELIKSGYIPQNLSVLKLESCFNDRQNLSNFACKVLNYFQVPTAYYIDYFDSANCETGSLTVDFIGKDEEFATLDLTEFYMEDVNLQNILIAYDSISENFYEENAHFNIDFEQQKKKNHETLAKMYFIRNWLLNDCDLDFKNIGILLNKNTGTISIAPAFDLEYCLDETISNIYYDNALYAKDDITFLQQQFPHVLEEFINEGQTFLYSNKGKSPLEKILNSCDLDKENKEHYKNILTQNFTILSGYIEKAKTCSSETEIETPTL